MSTQRETRPTASPFIERAAARSDAQQGLQEALRTARAKQGELEARVTEVEAQKRSEDRAALLALRRQALHQVHDAEELLAKRHPPQHRRGDKDQSGAWSTTYVDPARLSAVCSLLRVNVATVAGGIATGKTVRHDELSGRQPLSAYRREMLTDELGAEAVSFIVGELGFYDDMSGRERRAVEDAPARRLGSL